MKKRENYWIFIVLAVTLSGCASEPKTVQDYYESTMACLELEEPDSFRTITSGDGCTRLWSDRCQAFYKMGAAGSALHCDEILTSRKHLEFLKSKGLL